MGDIALPAAETPCPQAAALEPVLLEVERVAPGKCLDRICERPPKRAHESVPGPERSAIAMPGPCGLLGGSAG